MTDGFLNGSTESRAEWIGMVNSLLRQLGQTQDSIQQLLQGLNDKVTAQHEQLITIFNRLGGFDATLRDFNEKRSIIERRCAERKTLVDSIPNLNTRLGSLETQKGRDEQQWREFDNLRAVVKTQGDQLVAIWIKLSTWAAVLGGAGGLLTILVKWLLTRQV